MVSIIDWIKKMFGRKPVSENIVKEAKIEKKRRIKKTKKKHRIAKTRKPKKLRIKKIKRKLPKAKSLKPRKPQKILKIIAPKEQPKKKYIATKVPKEIVKEVIVADVMTKNPIVVHESDPLSYVVRLFSEKNFSGAPVIHNDNFVGMISESDIVKLVGVKDLLSLNTVGLKKLAELKVGEIMHRDPVFVYEYTKLSDAIDMMNNNNINKLPVLNEKRDIVGIIARRDVIRGISRELLFRVLKRKPEERIRLKVETDIDEILKAVERKGSIGVDEIQQKLVIPEDKVEEWGKVLEKHNLLEVFYPPFGKPEFRKKLK